MQTCWLLVALFLSFAEIVFQWECCCSFILFLFISPCSATLIASAASWLVLQAASAHSNKISELLKPSLATCTFTYTTYLLLQNLLAKDHSSLNFSFVLLGLIYVVLQWKMPFTKWKIGIVVKNLLVLPQKIISYCFWIFHLALLFEKYSSYLPFLVAGSLLTLISFASDNSKILLFPLSPLEIWFPDPENYGEFCTLWLGDLLWLEK